MADFSEGEAIDGVRMTWNVWPGSKTEAAKCVIPTAIVYEPLHVPPNSIVLPYSPLRCKSCRSILNPYCMLDFTGKIWGCPFCFHRNYFPESYSAVSETNLPPELHPQCTTVEYAPSNTPTSPPTFIFVIDTCVLEEELKFLKSALIQAIGLLPSQVLVGLITFGTLVHVHELGFSEIPKSYVFKGSKDVTKEEIIDSLGLVDGISKGLKPSGVIAGVHDGVPEKNIRRFLLPVSDCEFSFNAVLDELQGDPWHEYAHKRATRCTGVALKAAAGLLGACVPGSGGRILAFLGGPCTEGPGMVVGKDFSESLRSHKDLDKGAAPYYQQAVAFYETLSRQLVTQGHVLDIFACSLDQVGIAEIRVAVERTAGIIVMAESFNDPVFKGSVTQFFGSGESGLGLSFNGIFEMNCSKDLKVQGIIGPCTSSHKKGSCSSDVVIGQGNSTAWKLVGLDKNTTVSLFFEVVADEVADDLPPQVQQFYFQFVTYYQHSRGVMRMHVTTIARPWVIDAHNTEVLISGFDQETSAVVMARLASFKMETEEDFDATRWLDRALINFCTRFGSYEKNDPSSFSLATNLAIFPQFIFNLRRSQFVQVFNSSPDETAYHRILLNKETILNSVLMIQPSLISYSFSSPPEPALLDVTAIATDRILLLDTFFFIVIFHGMSIVQWRKEGYQNHPEHQVFAQLLRAPQNDAAGLMKERFPVPRLVICDQHSSQARFLLAKLNPSVTHKSESGATRGDIIFTDDVSFEAFMEHLHKLAVRS
ncbi:hypothetical protein KP509_22G050800 [Ceratopteris richardii]|uniref:Protein transport protein SEC23 n=1 Tax=Ceratopteris richardii TaxID=49495 RepID=A0A8T2S7R5_CERRI|nr:hypothetical protein KP509_22G050800 [Ceratopteris richardii]KAH7307231.1 hypothetical protein KP509_22G050800 [Ceratopteris richardii]KAH7307232.1 hypothetical protein KP509_22G050800 [Ceratopteris richardii]